MTAQKEEEFYIWLAGLVDGEGCLSISFRTNGQPQFRLIITQNDQASLEYIRSIVGKCGLYQKKGPRRNTVWADTYDLSIAARTAKNVVERILPYSRIKRPQLIAFRQCMESWQNARTIPSKEWKTIVA